MLVGESDASVSLFSLGHGPRMWPPSSKSNGFKDLLASNIVVGRRLQVSKHASCFCFGQGSVILTLFFSSSYVTI